jgi:hypothetical protein
VNRSLTGLSPSWGKKALMWYSNMTSDPTPSSRPEGHTYTVAWWRKGTLGCSSLLDTPGQSSLV